MTRWREFAGAVLTAALLAATPAQAAPRSCSWSLHVSGDELNAVAPDEAAQYWAAGMPLPRGGQLQIAGRFPHARYLSFNTYDETFQEIDDINDAQIEPDHGSVNPFRPGADRRAERRRFTLRMQPGVVPAMKPRPNTLYTGRPEGSQPQGAALVIRIYRPDRALGGTGGVSLPKLTIVDPDGTRTAVPDCPYPDGQLGLLTQLLALSGAPPAPATGVGALGRAVPRWSVTISPPANVANLTLDTEVAHGLAGPTSDALEQLFPRGGFGTNADSAYMSTTFSSEFGPVLAFRGRGPTFPKTFAGQRRMGRGQVRYWSLCTNGHGGQFYDCRADDQIPLRRGRYLIAISTAAARPSNATRRCGVAWIAAGPDPQSILALRHILPAPTFAHAIHTAEPGTEEATLGGFYPRGRYYDSVGDFEALGCPASRRGKRA